MEVSLLSVLAVLRCFVGCTTLTQYGDSGPSHEPKDFKVTYDDSLSHQNQLAVSGEDNTQTLNWTSAENGTITCSSAEIYSSCVCGHRPHLPYIPNIIAYEPAQTVLCNETNACLEMKIICAEGIPCHIICGYIGPHEDISRSCMLVRIIGNKATDLQIDCYAGGWPETNLGTSICEQMTVLADLSPGGSLLLDCEGVHACRVQVVEMISGMVPTLLHA